MHIESFFNMWLNLYVNKVKKYSANMAELIRATINGACTHYHYECRIYSAIVMRDLIRKRNKNKFI